MRTISQLALLLFAAAGCGNSRTPLATHPQGYAARMEAADEHSRRAEELRQSVKTPHAAVNPGNYQCGDRDMSDQLTSGGERLVPEVPCWDPVEENAERRRTAAAREDQRAQKERRAAASLVEAEVAACRGISPDEIEHSPFAHRKAIAEVIPHTGGGAVRGVRIVFKPVLGLTAPWMEKAIACHRAHFERLGEPTTYLSDDPTLVPGATTTVATRAGHLEVLIETGNDVSAHVALGRAQDLVRPRTAGR
jgi:hypothetical protein